MQPDDGDLVRRSQQQDLEAFNMIVERYQSQVFNLAARIVGNRATAEDATQEAFISAHRAIKGFRGGSLRAWLMRIASNTSLDFIRASRRRPEASLDLLLENPTFQVPAGGTSPEQHTLRRELGGEIQRAILSLSDDQRTILVLVDVQGLSYEETAEATGASLGTVKSRLSRARSRVRDFLRQHLELLPEEFRQV